MRLHSIRVCNIKSTIFFCAIWWFSLRTLAQDTRMCERKHVSPHGTIQRQCQCWTEICFVCISFARNFRFFVRFDHQKKIRFDTILNGRKVSRPKYQGLSGMNHSLNSNLHNFILLSLQIIEQQSIGSINENRNSAIISTPNFELFLFFFCCAVTAVGLHVCLQ